ncbi:Hsp20/alpha crystallin family protein [Tellurirhabdus bombi]|uniref:Hsp20/alpha crystallin family protein n=1 Tax=Tellurirhabdus bombi TaxID=2907205 RepID=UPI001F1CC68B|nr:Hsp20/alpha crystallin family protein [Tellurirhabdus bombi]
MTTVVRYPSLFNRQFNPFFGVSDVAPRVTTAQPAVNVKEDETAFHIEVAVPGFKKEDFAINLLNNRLTISAKQEQKDEEKTEKFTRREFGYTAFERSFQLPKNVDVEQIQAAYTDGILKLDLPKVEVKQPEPKQIAIA